MLKAISVRVLAVAVLAALPAAQAQTVVQKEIPAAAITDLFTFNTPVGAGTNRVLVAKFVVDNTAFNLELRLLMPSALQDFSLTSGNVAVVDQDTAATIATLRLRDMTPTEPTATPATYRIIKATLTYDDAYSFAAAAPWTIQAKPTGGVVHYIGYWAEGVAGEAAAEAVVTRPRLIVPQASLTGFASYVPFANPANMSFGDVHINLPDQYIPDKQWEFVNVGPGALQLTAANPAVGPAGPYRIENYPSPPLSVLPMGSFSRRVTAKPTALGAVPNVNVTLTAAAPASNLQLNLTGTTGIRLRSAVLFDLSGSMLLDKNNNNTNNDDQRKVSLARIGALELAELYQAILPNGLLSLSIYPNRAGPAAASAEQLIPPNESTANLPSFRNHLDRGLAHPSLIVPNSLGAGTPMAEGIARVYNELSDRGANERAAVFQFGDGEHNINSAGARPTPASWYNWNTFRNAGIPFFTVPYGATGEGWLNTFQQLSLRTGGLTFPADITNDLELQKEFKNALANALDLETLADPDGSVQIQETKEHAICVTESTQQVVFSVHWLVRNSQAITLELRPPTGPIITAATVDPNVTRISGVNYAGFVVRGARLAGHSGVGAWTLRVRGNVATNYSYQAYARDSLQIGSLFTVPGILSEGMLSFKVIGGVSYLDNLQVTANVTAPAASIPNFLATTAVSKDLINRVPDSLGDMTMAQKKIYALTHFTDTKIPTGRTTSQIQFAAMKAGGGDSTSKSAVVTAAQPIQFSAQDLAYQSAFTNASYAGRYDFNVSLIGTTKTGACFQRQFPYYTFADLVLSQAAVTGATVWEPARTLDFLDLEVTKILANSPPPNTDRRFVRFTPKVGGNYFGIGRASEIALAVNGAQARGPLQDMLDGSYVQLVEYNSGANPSVQVTVGDIVSTSISLQAGTPWWIWLLLLLLGLVILAIIVWKRRAA